MTGLYLIAAIILIIVSWLLIVIMIGMIGVIICIPNTKKYFAAVYNCVRDNGEISDRSLEKIFSEQHCNFAYRFIKRSFDIIFSLIGIISFFPQMLVIAILLRLEHKGEKIIRKRKIVGYKGKDIYVYSFRPSKKRNGFLYFMIHELGLNNLPMLLNVLNGSLCLVGLSILDNFDDKGRMRIYDYEKPGVICLANIYNAQRYVDQYRWDLLYLEGRNFRMDLRIILGTIVMPKGGYSRKEKTSGNENRLEIRNVSVRMEVNGDLPEKDEKVKDVALICPNCLQEIPIELSKGLFFCPYCGSRVDAVNKDKTEN